MKLGIHPLQRAGALAAAELAGRHAPEQVDAGDLDHLVEVIVATTMQAARAPRHGKGWAWQQALAAAYPNAAPTHPKRAGIGDADLVRRVRGLFACGDVAVQTCWTCGAPASAKWSKALLPLAAPAHHVNHQPAGGQPLCRPCRIALWCLPWGCGLTPGSLVTVTSPDPELERELVAGNVRQARGLQAAETLPAEPPYARWWAQLLARPAQLDAARWRNDNRAPWLRRWSVSQGMARWASDAHRDETLEPALRRVLAMGPEPEIRALRQRRNGMTAARLVGLANRAALDELLKGGDCRPLTRLSWQLTQVEGQQ